MSIYSQNLGRARFTATTGFVTIYTVPPTAGPAVVKHISAFCGVGLETYVFFNDGTTRFVIMHLDNTTGSLPVDVQLPMTQPLAPGWFIEAQCAQDLVPGNEADIFVGGYQFSDP